MNGIGFAALALALVASPLSAQGFGSVPNEAEPVIVAEDEADGESKEIAGKAISAEEADKSVISAKNGAKVTVSNATLSKTGNTSNDGQSNFYGLNAAVVSSSKSTVSLSGVTITTDADGANAVFATGNGSKINAKNVRISTKQNSSRGLDATYGGEVNASDVFIDTKGAHCAAFATDRGEGTISVNGATATTAGEGSPVIYSTGNISVKNLTGRATGSEIACIEGKNSISIDTSNIEGAGPNGIMLYQSFSGDAGVGTSVLNVKNSTLKSSSNGAFFYITNTRAKINLSQSTLSFPSGVLIRSSGNNSERGWGVRGANGGNLDFKAEKQSLTGDIICDEISTINLDFADGVFFTGAINADNSGAVTLALSKNAQVRLTADSYIESISDADKKFKNIISNGYNLYYNKNAAANKALKGKSYKLSGGGKLIGIAIERKAVQVASQQTQGDFHGENMGTNPPPMPNEMSKVTGVIKLYGSAPMTTIGFVTDDGKEYKLSVLPPPLQGEMKGQGDKKGQEVQEMKAPGEPPKMEGHFDMSFGDKKQKPLSEDELKQLTGLHVELTGFVSDKTEANALKDGVFVVFEATEK